jgi:hypothetical protein
MHLRQSRDSEGNELAISSQREGCLKLCQHKGWNDISEYPDNDRSATNGKPRPSYQRMMKDIADGKVARVVVWDLDRLHRQPIELEHLTNNLTDRLTEIDPNNLWVGSVYLNRQGRAGLHTGHMDDFYTPLNGHVVGMVARDFHPEANPGRKRSLVTARLFHRENPRCSRQCVTANFGIPQLPLPSEDDGKEGDDDGAEDVPMEEEVANLRNYSHGLNRLHGTHASTADQYRSQLSCRWGCADIRKLQVAPKHPHAPAPPPGRVA